MFEQFKRVNVITARMFNEKIITRCLSCLKIRMNSYDSILVKITLLCMMLLSIQKQQSIFEKFIPLINSLGNNRTLYREILEK